MSSNFTITGLINGPIQEVAEGYTPETVILDSEFEEIFEKQDNASKKELFLARDYVVKKIGQIFSEDVSFVPLSAVLAEQPNERLEALFWGLKSCSCCWRHCHNTPEAIDSSKDRNMLDRVTEEMVRERNCHCHCRTYKRALRRAYQPSSIKSATVKDNGEDLTIFWRE